MTDKIEFPGGWAKIRDPQDVTEKQRRPLGKLQRRLAGSSIADALLALDGKPTEEQVKALVQPVLGSDDWDLLDESGDLLIVALVEEWSFEKPITVDEVQNLPGKAYKALREACDPLLMPLLGITDGSEIEDPDSNFGGSSD